MLNCQPKKPDRYATYHLRTKLYYRIRSSRRYSVLSSPTVLIALLSSIIRCSGQFVRILINFGVLK